jgi:hypothetical protein
MPKITEIFVNELKPPKRGQSFAFDSKTPNFGVRITARGGKAFVWQGPYGDEMISGVRITLGKCSRMSVDDARRDAELINAALPSREPKEFWEHLWRQRMEAVHANLLVAKLMKDPRVKELLEVLTRAINEGDDDTIAAIIQAVRAGLTAKGKKNG